jgi:hypothetical protein
MCPETYALQCFLADLAMHGRNINYLAENGSADAALELLKRISTQLREWGDYERTAWYALKPLCKETVDLTQGGTS